MFQPDCRQDGNSRSSIFPWDGIQKSLFKSVQENVKVFSGHKKRTCSKSFPMAPKRTTLTRKTLFWNVDVLLVKLRILLCECPQKSGPIILIALITRVTQSLHRLMVFRGFWYVIISSRTNPDSSMKICFQKIRLSSIKLLRRICCISCCLCRHSHVQ
jgi:hypothetical protein